jgi:hypothetical protein
MAGTSNLETADELRRAQGRLTCYAVEARSVWVKALTQDLLFFLRAELRLLGLI